MPPLEARGRDERSTRKRWIVGGLCSVLLHALPILPSTLFGFDMDMDIELPEFDLQSIELADIDPALLRGDGGETEEPQPLAIPEAVPPPPELTPEDGLGPEPEVEKPKPKVFGEKRSNVEKLGPPGSHYFVLIAPRKVAKLKFATQVVDIMSALPDFIFIIDGAGFDVLRDFDYILLTSPNLAVVSFTFVTVQYRLPQSEVQAGLDRAAAAQGLVINWEEQGGRLVGDPVPKDPEVRDRDTRVFVFLDDKRAAYLPRKFLADVIADAEDETGQHKAAAGYSEQLVKLNRVARQNPDAGLVVNVQDVHNMAKERVIKFTRDGKQQTIPLPNDLELKIEAADEPKISLDFEFASEDDAEGFASFWTDEVSKLIDAVPFLFRGTVRGIYEGFALEQSKKRDSLRGRFNDSQTTLILDQAVKLSQRVAEHNGDAEDMARRKQEREALWKAREGGKLTPSEALEKIRAEREGTPPQP
ncbi:MAG: hypothetical protein KC636_21395, partial [Myxococcales bacterium]|nr:hypothetical protein [Myxococcales bacterium]